MKTNGFKLHGIYLKNFQSIKNATFIDLNGITVLCGPNSAGKSSIVDALNYFRNSGFEEDSTWFDYFGALLAKPIYRELTGHTMDSIIGIEFSYDDFEYTGDGESRRHEIIDSSGFSMELLKLARGKKVRLIWSSPELAVYIDGERLISREFHVFQGMVETMSKGLDWETNSDWALNQFERPIGGVAAELFSMIFDRDYDLTGEDIDLYSRGMFLNRKNPLLKKLPHIDALSKFTGPRYGISTLLGRVLARRTKNEVEIRTLSLMDIASFRYAPVLEKISPFIDSNVLSFIESVPRVLEQRLSDRPRQAIGESEKDRLLKEVKSFQNRRKSALLADIESIDKLTRSLMATFAAFMHLGSKSLKTELQHVPGSRSVIQGATPIYTARHKPRSFRGDGHYKYYAEDFTDIYDKPEEPLSRLGQAYLNVQLENEDGLGKPCWHQKSSKNNLPLIDFVESSLDRLLPSLKDQSIYPVIVTSSIYAPIDTPFGYRIYRTDDEYPDQDLDTNVKNPPLVSSVYLRVFNEMLEADLPPEDVGCGLSLTLPILAALGSGPVALVEQPELHLHPRAQCEIADVFIKGQKEGCWSYVETHSEHFILRLLRRIRQTANQELLAPDLELQPEQLQLYYFQPTEKGTVVRRIRVDERGEFLNPWPDGFFAERDEELFS
jgi:hypothetical protein